jgi:hypothetical protein
MLQRSGVRAVECQIIPQELFDWCAQHGKVNNAAARAEFVSEKLRATHSGVKKLLNGEALPQTRFDSPPRCASCVVGISLIGYAAICA